MKKSQLKEYIKNEILSILNEAEEKETDTEETGTEETEITPAEDTATEETTPSAQDVQKELMDALEAAKKLGDKKLVRQIGNALTYFTRSQITKDEEA